MVSSSTRPDGRTFDQLRPVRITRGWTRHAEGSVLIEFGGTRVLCTCSVLPTVPGHVRGTGRGWLSAEYGMLPRSTHTRSDREAAKGKQSGRTQEIQRLIGRSLRAAVDLAALGERTLQVDCDVLQADGGTRTASITGAYVAVADALGGLVKSGVMSAESGVLKSQVAAVSVGLKDGVALLDLDYLEDSSCDTDLNLVMTSDDGIIEIQGTAEGRAMSRAQLDSLLTLGQRGMQSLFKAQAQALQVEVAR